MDLEKSLRDFLEMLSLTKLVWLGVILIVVWNFFRFYEKRRAFMDNGRVDTEKKGGEMNDETETIAAHYCASCATFTTAKRCDCAD